MAVHGGEQDGLGIASVPAFCDDVIVSVPSSCSLLSKYPERPPFCGACVHSSLTYETA